jgi:hypothetical protein
MVSLVLRMIIHNFEAFLEHSNQQRTMDSLATRTTILNFRMPEPHTRQLRWLGICALILSGTILCVSVGVAVGVSTNSVDLEISVLSGLALHLCGSFCILGI